MTALEILERTFRRLVMPVVVGDNPRDLGGVYLLACRGEVVYVGQSADIASRLYMHARRDLRFDAALWVPLPGLVRSHYEGAFIRALRPRDNRNVPPHCGHDNEILEGFGLPPHDDEYANAEAWRPACRDAATEPRVSPIRDARRALGLSQQQVAIRLGVSSAAVGQWETGATRPSMTNLIDLARLLGVSAESLVRTSEST